MSAAAAYRTTMDGFTSRGHKMNLAQEILESAKPLVGNLSWFSALSADHQVALLEVRDSWRKSAGESGISASQMARAICEKLGARGIRVAKYRQVQRWLTQD